MSDKQDVIARSPDHSVVLTSSRVRLDHRISGGKRFMSMTLDAVSSCGFVTKSHPTLVFLCFLCGGGGFYLLNVKHDNTLGTAGIVLGFLMLITYLLTRSSVFAISSAGEAITVNVTGDNRKALIQFIDAIENAKLEFLGKDIPPAETEAPLEEVQSDAAGAS